MNRSAAYGYGTLASAATTAVEIVCGFGQLWLLAVILDKANFGRLAFALAAAHVLSLAASRGFERLIVFRLSRADAPPGVMTGRNLAGAATGAALATGLVAAALLWLAAPLAGAAASDPTLAWWLRALAAVVPVSAIIGGYAAWYQARQRVARAVLGGRAAPAALVTGALAATWLFDLGAAGVVGALVGGRAIVALAWAVGRPVNPLLLARLDRADRAYVLKAAGTGVLSKGLRQADILMLLPIAGPLVTGEYAIAARLAWLLRAGHDLLAPVFTPRIGFLLSRGGAGRASLAEEYDRSRAAALLAGLLLAVPLAACGPSVLGLFGAYEAAYPVLLLLVGARLAMVTFGFGGITLLMAGHAGWALATNVLLLAANVALNAILIPLFGGAGAALATLLAVVSVKGLTAVILYRIERLVTVGPSELAALVLIALATTFGAADLLPPVATAVVLSLVLVLVAARHVDVLRAARARAVGRFT